MSTRDLVPNNQSNNSSMSPRLRRKGNQLQQQAALEVFTHGLQAQVRAQCTIRDSEALADVVQASLHEELRLLSWGMHEAGTSSAKLELVARKVNLLSAMNDRLISHRFGG